MRGGRAWIGGVLLAAGGSVWAWTAPPPSTPQRAESQHQEADRGVRGRAQPGAWDRGPIRRFQPVRDRAAAREQSIAGRAARRAYSGAPPVMPHSAIFGAGTKDCLDCHSEGMSIGKRVAHPMSHPPLANCVQCHVESANRQFEPSPDAPTSFEGLASPGPGPRWTSHAPPQIPHSTMMRTHCLACHGEFGYLGLRTTHAERANCVQCHVTTNRAR